MIYVTQPRGNQCSSYECGEKAEICVIAALDGHTLAHDLCRRCALELRWMLKERRVVTAVGA